MLVAFTTLSAAAYAKIIDRREIASRMMDSLELGEQNFYIVQNERCAGTLKREITEENRDVTIEITALLEALLKDDILPIELSFRAEFNSLGQHFASIFEVSSPQGTLTLGALEINPIKTSLRFSGEHGSFSHAVDIPGPIELHRNSETGFNLRYQHMQRSNLDFRSSLFSRLVEQLDISVSSRLPDQCRGRRHQQIDIRPLESLLHLAKTNGPLAALSKLAAGGL